MPAQKSTTDRLADIEAKLDRLVDLADKAAVFLESPVAKYLAARKKLAKLPDGQ